ncbi:hypothetical protein [Mucilaginibacter sp.]|jgi:hypothetical protein|uniref:hypothetical protein n=1 Tax=Mucilaginibacter sp. TaxID=1882438 RepID=UPI002C37FEFB|nr:hypothetical protein [Mucilaginibacter sp.]HTI57426.1 hypothetical protein [Mucilaginibacter sp.]
MKYSKQATENFAKQIHKEECLESINQLIIDEGCVDQNLNFLGDEVVLNMDCVEGKVASIEKRSPVKSMDSAFVAEDISGTSQEIVFVEYRFNYKNLSNLKKQDLFGKVVGSTSTLNQPSNIHGNYYFIFNSNLKQQAKNRFNRMNPAMPQHYVATDMHDIKNIFFD